MKRGFLAMTMAAALLVAATGGTALAKDHGAKNAEAMSSANQGWTSLEAMETGNLPDAPGGVSAGDRMTAPVAEVPTVEAGGERLRVGIDTGP